MRVFIPRFLGALLYLVGLTLVGVVGYTLIEGWEVHDALYMSVITIRAVGLLRGAAPLTGRQRLHNGPAGRRDYRHRRLVCSDHLVHRRVRPQ